MEQDYTLPKPQTTPNQPSHQVVQKILTIASAECLTHKRNIKIYSANCYQNICIDTAKIKICLN